ncbi:respiratory nitrate reductase subunit gamma [Staphylococcus nepalensis]|uniref:respiratory nitrate reductase subunit gamma n=1 Tax=Staphylococcus nepalensis TaxID=214473 RepID=UPI00383A79D1
MGEAPLIFRLHVFQHFYCLLLFHLQFIHIFSFPIKYLKRVPQHIELETIPKEKRIYKN